MKLFCSFTTPNLALAGIITTYSLYVFVLLYAFKFGTKNNKNRFSFTNAKI
jgi:hypothetical protein